MSGIRVRGIEISEQFNTGRAMLISLIGIPLTNQSNKKGE